MIKCIAVDDEPLALKQIQSYISHIPNFELVATCKSAGEALQVLNSKPVDVMFIDINMPDLNGMEFVKSLNTPPTVVFTTAYSDYAVDAYKVGALDYLLKPFDLDDFARTAAKIKEHYDLIQASQVSDADEDNAIFFKTEYKVVRVDMNSIVYVEAMSEYLRIHTDDREKPLVVLLSMKKMEERLPSSMFMRVHRSHIVNLKKIKEVSRSHIILGETISLPIGDLYRDNFMRYLNRKFLTK